MQDSTFPTSSAGEAPAAATAVQQQEEHQGEEAAASERPKKESSKKRLNAKASKQRRRPSPVPESSPSPAEKKESGDSDKGRGSQGAESHSGDAQPGHDDLVPGNFVDDPSAAEGSKEDILRAKQFIATAFQSRYRQQKAEHRVIEIRKGQVSAEFGLNFELAQVHCPV